jgi:DNA-directed RNA polymerase specialized sigma24 family protein
VPDADGYTFAEFFEDHHAELSRLAYLLTGAAELADDLAADALGQVRRHWSRVGGDDPAAHARGIVAGLTREPRWPFGASRPAVTSRHAARRRREAANRREAGSGAWDTRAALRRLPHRRRACVVLRYAFGLTEQELARALGISVGAVRSRTARGMRQLAELLGGPPEVTRLGGREAAR